MCSMMKKQQAKILKYSVGIDASSEDMKFCFSTIDEQQHVTQKGSRKFNNTEGEARQSAEWIEKYRKDKTIPMVITIEATGTYYENFAFYFHKAGYAVSVVLASHARDYMKSCGLKSKTDKIDAWGLSRMGAERSLPVWQPLSEYVYRLRSLTRKRKQLNDIRTATLNQDHATQFSMYELKEVEQVNEGLAKQLNEHIRQVDIAIDEILQEQQGLKEKVEMIVEKIAGVGKLTLVTLLAETGCFELFESIAQLISYSGYDVIEDESGKRTGSTRISKKGNSYIRYALYMPALNVVRWKVKPFEDLYTRVLERNPKLKKKANVAVQRKLLIILYTLWKKDKAFNPEYSQTTIGEKEPESSFGKKDQADETLEEKQRA
jgi:transposase